MASHSSFYQGSKRISPLKIRNPSILPSQIMPSPTGAPFNFAEMPWSYGMKPGQVMEFNAVIRPSPIAIPHGPPSPIPSTSSPPMFGLSMPQTFLPEIRKRKPDPDVIPVPSKQYLTEEVMSSHFNNLHLSSEYTAHDVRSKTSESVVPAHSTPEEAMLLEDLNDMNNATEAYRVCMSPQELEERLKKAQRIAICEEVRKLDSRAEILPQALLDRIEKPCTALMIWQPPQERLQSFISKVSENLEEHERTERKTAKKNSSSKNNNNDEDVDTMAISDEPLPDLPEYDEDLDFEPEGNGNNWQQRLAPFPITMDVEM
ncbi:uncharacterized protein LOC128731276 [Anopheles nili]|uniref:uncharacterized protein LOC128731276 n=1 Tax=Anopheles nili TaxID=185578 RepID=UPI00237A77EE|nr:uncharacterized protein LOC128731276 [Anopheles nili]